MMDLSKYRGWAEDVRRQMRADYEKLTDPGDRMQFLEDAAALLNVKKSDVLLFLRSTSPVNTNAPKEQTT